MYNGNSINYTVVYANSNNQQESLIVIPPPATTAYNDQTGTSQLKRKRTRTAFTEAQIRELENEFHKCIFLCKERRLDIAQRLGLQEKSVKIWFQNRRMKEKKAKEQPISDEYQQISSQENRISNCRVSYMARDVQSAPLTTPATQPQLSVYKPLILQLGPGTVVFNQTFRSVPSSQHYQQQYEKPVKQPTFEMPMNTSIHQQPEMYAPELQAKQSFQQYQEPEVSFEEMLELVRGPFGNDNVLINFDETARKLISDALDL